MSDSISRQAAIDALGDKPLAWTEGEYELGLQNQWQSDVDALKELPSADAPHWISCSERLPEEDGLYLVTTSKGQVQMHVFNHNGNSEEYWMRCNKAWMPLPDPYKEERKDDEQIWKSRL